MTYYAIKNKDGKFYTSGYAAHNIKFTKNGKMFSSIKKVKSIINGMLKGSIESDSRYMLAPGHSYSKSMKEYISTFTIVEIETNECNILTGLELMEMNK